MLSKLYLNECNFVRLATIMAKFGTSVWEVKRIRQLPRHVTLRFSHPAQIWNRNVLFAKLSTFLVSSRIGEQ
jgi:hypothetical protein